MMARFVGNLLGLLYVLALCAAGLAAIGLLLAFGLSVADHYSSDPTFYPFHRSPVRWWELGASAGAAVLAVGVYSLAPEGDDYYCPNCRCESCERERERRRHDEVVTAALVGGMAGGAAGGAAGGSIGGGGSS